MKLYNQDIRKMQNNNFIKFFINFAFFHPQPFEWEIPTKLLFI